MNDDSGQNPGPTSGVSSGLPRTPPTQRPLTATPRACTKCGYSLIGLHVPGHCPECGTLYKAEPVAPGIAGLPEPEWAERPGFCVSCAYSLDGLAAPGVCPECGLAFGDRQLVLSGVPNAMKSSSGWRRAAWAVLFVAMILHWQTWVFQIRYGWWAPIAVFGVLGLGVVWLLLTGPRERRGTERFIVTEGGITRVVPRTKAAGESIGSLFIPWGMSDSVHIKRISPFWKRLRVGRAVGRTLQDVVFDAGIRCRDGVDAHVRQTIEQYLGAPGGPGNAPGSGGENPGPGP